MGNPNVDPSEKMGAADKPNGMYIRSACCNAHWELAIIEDEGAFLFCEKCGQAAGSQVSVTVHLDNLACGCCGEKETPEKKPIDGPPENPLKGKIETMLKSKGVLTVLDLIREWAKENDPEEDDEYDELVRGLDNVISLFSGGRV